MKSTLTANEDVLAILRRASIDETGLTLSGQLSRPEYTAVNKFLATAGADWNKKAKRHLFTRPGAKDALLGLLQTGQLDDKQKRLQQYFTPPLLAAEMVSEAWIKEGMKCLEPSAGHGAIAVEMLAAGGVVACIDIDEAATTILKQHPVLRPLVITSDFLEIIPEPIYDRVVMNPPFNGDADIEHVLHARRFLKPDGVLIALMSPGFTFGSNRARREFRLLVRECGHIVREVEAGTFDDAGSRSVIVRLMRTDDATAQ